MNISQQNNQKFKKGDKITYRPFGYNFGQNYIVIKVHKNGDLDVHNAEMPHQIFSFRQDQYHLLTPTK